MANAPRFGVMAYSFHGLRNIGAMNIFTYLEAVRYRYQLDTADIWNLLIEKYDDEYLAMVKDNLDERGLEVVNFCCDGAHLWDDDADMRAANEKRAALFLKAAKVFGAKTVRFDVGVREDTIPKDKMDYVAHKYEEYCAAAAAFGAQLGPENHWGGSIDYGSMEELFSRVKAKNFGLLLHLGNWGGDEDEKDRCDRAFASRAMHIHINYEHCVDADRVLPPLAEAGYKGVWSIESHKATNEYNNVAFQLAQAKRVLAPYTYDGSWKVAPPMVDPDNHEENKI